MASAPLLAGAGALLAAAGLLVWATDIRRALHRVAGAILVLWGATTIATALLPGADGPASATFYARLALWYGLAVPLLLAMLPGAALGRSRADRAVVPVLAVVTLAAYAALALAPALYVASVRQVDGRWSSVSGPLLYLFGALAASAQAYVVVRCASQAAGPDGAQGARAAALATALALPLLHTAGFFASFLVFTPEPPLVALFLVRAGVSIAAALVAAPLLVRLARAVPARAASLGALFGGVVALGVLDGIVGGRRLDDVSYGGYETSLVVVRVAFAFAIATAALRFGLADVGRAQRARAGAAIQMGLRLGGAILLASVAFVLVGGGIAFGVAGILGAVAAIALAPPARAAADRLLLPPSDPRAMAERARTYAAAVAAARAKDGRILPAGEALLAQMRADLGISEQEHALLVSGVASREKERYHTLETLGRGSTAQVELAVDEVAGRRVVVKRFTGLRDPAAVLTEARSLAAVRHPRVVPFIEVDRRGDDVYLVLAYAEGGSARQLLDREGPLPAERATALTRDLLEGLEALHAAGLVHCDVKPENLLLDAQGRGMLGDLGSAAWGGARAVAPQLADATLTGAGAEGSLSTVCPEALRGAAPAPTRDVYATGALLYRLLTGEHHVQLADATLFQARERILLDAPRLPHARVPPAIELVLRKALAKRPADRYQSAREMRDALVTAGARARA